MADIKSLAEELCSEVERLGGDRIQLRDFVLATLGSHSLLYLARAPLVGAGIPRSHLDSLEKLPRATREQLARQLAGRPVKPETQGVKSDAAAQKPQQAIAC